MDPVNYIVTAADEFDLEDRTGGVFFDGIEGAFQPKQHQVRSIVEEGFPGEIWVDTGLRGVEFPIVTKLHTATASDALSQIAAYTDLNDGAPYQVFYKGVSMGFYRVKGVVPGPIVPVMNAIGTIIDNPAAFFACVWTLVSTEPPPEGP